MTVYDARTVWRALDGVTREEIDRAVAGGVPVPDAALAAVAVWRVLRRRREWRVAAVLSAPVAAAGALLLPPGAALVVLGTLAVPAWRLAMLRRAMDVNAGLAVRVPQRGTPPGRPATSELRRRLKRASRRA